MTTETAPGFLTDIDLDVIYFIERFHSSNGRTPTRSETDNRFTGLNSEWWASFDANPLVTKSFSARGIIYPAAEDRFTDEQMHAVAAMMDTVDRRSDEKKLRDLGITTRKWAAWLQDDEFASYLRDRSEKLLANSTHEAHKGLIKGVRNGNLAAVKTYYEITGRYDPNQETQIDVRRVLHTFIEVLQKHIKDPVMLHAIAMELSSVATAESMSTGLTNQMMGGAQRYNQTISSSAVPSIAPPPPMEGFEE